MMGKTDFLTTIRASLTMKLPTLECQPYQLSIENIKKRFLKEQEELAKRK